MRNAMKKPALKQLGFTLIELMVVVAIIGILMAAGILAFTNAQQNARDSRRRADIDAISKAMEQYYDNNLQAYPTSNAGLSTYFPSGSVPTDPQGTAYNITYGGGNWCACATLERTGRGNASAGAGGSCTYATSGDLFCTSRRQ
jgi:prepilin-type N-terminal cleavage/methylation domain-containing protein